MRILNPSSFPIFSWYGFFSLLPVPKTEIHLRGTQYGSNQGLIEAVNKYLGDQEKVLYFEGIRKLTQRWATCIALKGDYIEKVIVNNNKL